MGVFKSPNATNFISRLVSIFGAGLSPEMKFDAFLTISQQKWWDLKCKHPSFKPKWSLFSLYQNMALHTIAYMCLWELHLEAYGLSDCHPWSGWSKNRLLSTSSWPNGPLLISPSAKVQGHGILHSSKYLWALVGPKAVLGVQKGARGLAPQTGVWPQPYSTMQLGTWWHFP